MEAAAEQDGAVCVCAEKQEIKHRGCSGGDADAAVRQSDGSDR